MTVFVPFQPRLKNVRNSRAHASRDFFDSQPKGRNAAARHGGREDVSIHRQLVDYPNDLFAGSREHVFYLRDRISLPRRSSRSSRKSARGGPQRSSWRELGSAGPIPRRRSPWGAGGLVVGDVAPNS